MDASSVLSDDLSESDYDVISSPGTESSIADLGAFMNASHVYEPAPSEAAREKFVTVNLSAEEIRLFVRNSLKARTIYQRQGEAYPEHRPVRVYVDGIFDVLNAR